MSEAPQTVSLSLVSHTNVGKTSLARTLLARDIGEVRDEAHVTESAESQLWIESPAGDRLLLWDTPGFGDSLRLARCLAQAGNPLGWFLSEVWDRWRDRAFWATQRALKHVLGEADVVLYLVNAAEAPEDAGYLDAELNVLGLIGKPVVALLNQLGPVGREGDSERLDALAARWRQRLSTASAVNDVLPLDAFTRCWLQEGVLWRALASVVPAPKRPAFMRLEAAWQERQAAVWRSAMAELARRVARAASDVEPLEAEGWRGPLRAVGGGLGKLLGMRADAGDSARERAMSALAERLDSDVRQSIDCLISLHGLDGRAGGEVLGRLAQHYASREPIDEGRAALWGGALSGALAGLKADLVSGGLTLGGGLLAGGVIGALAAAGAARGVNLVRGVGRPQVSWDVRVLDSLVASALLGYLAVAHHGRGRGAWLAAAPPAAWIAAVDTSIAEQRAALDALWQRRLAGDAAPLDAFAARVCVVIETACRSMLARLYPNTTPMVASL